MLVNLTGDGKTWSPLSRVVEIREVRDEDRNALSMQRARMAGEGRIGAMPEAPEGCTNSPNLVRTVALVEVGGGAIGVLYLTADLPTVLDRACEIKTIDIGRGR